MTTTKSTTLILVDSKANSNKFYRLELDASGLLTKTFGRVGASGQVSTDHSGLAGFERTLHEKKRKGYREVDVAESTPAATSRTVDNSRLHTVAKTGLVSGKAKENAAVNDLIERIVQANAHDILESSGGMIKVDTTGRVKTPVGLVTSSSIGQATVLLDRLEHVRAQDRTPLLEQYLTLVPQKVGSRAGWADRFFDSPNVFAYQRDFLTQLRDSVSFYEAQLKTQAQAPADSAADIGFKYKIKAVADGGAVFKRIQAFYESSKNGNHNTYGMKLRRVYELVDAVGAKKYAEVAAEIRNEQEMWHGTRAANLLSILRTGLYVPPTSGTNIVIAGRMFGDGVYLSNQSTKSLQYAGSGGRGTAFMLLNDVAMGSEFRPDTWSNAGRLARTTLNKFGKPFNSINVKAGTAGVRNHEAIVWNVDQIRCKHLVEFTS